MKYLIALILIALPAFALMLRPGIFTMHDFHVFRQQQFDLCVKDGVFPCRWSPDAGKGFGEPVFNFYAQFPYWLGQLFRLTGISIISSTKAVFILSLVGSGMAMFLFARRWWGNAGAMLSAVLYMYAPYRAVDIWVRGALPESLSFIFYPLILWLLDEYWQTRHPRWVAALAVVFALLITTHNLSTLMFAPFVAVWVVFKIISLKSVRPLVGVIGSGIAAVLLAAYYLLPVALESSLTTLAKTTQSYYDFHLHYTTLFQLLISRMWGYGGSGWGPNDTLSFSVGHVHWIVVASATCVLAGKMMKSRKITLPQIVFGLAAFLGAGALFLTHGKAEFLWESVPGLPFVQFPWRFLTQAVFFWSFAGGFAVMAAKRFSIIVFLVVSFAAVLTNISFFRPDIWRSVDDTAQFSGLLWDEQRSSALQDFWPVASQTSPKNFAPPQPEVITGPARVVSFTRKSHAALAVIESPGPAFIHFPIVNFPGWAAWVDGQPVPVTPSSELGLVGLFVPAGTHQVQVRFQDTWPRQVGNIVSAVTFAAIAVIGIAAGKRSFHA